MGGNMVDVALVRQERFARIQLNRPDKLNALSPDLLRQLVELCEELSTDDSVGVVSLEGVGQSFSAGADLPAFSRELKTSPEMTADLGRIATEAIFDLPQVTVAAMHGHCVGGALVLAAACDIRIASDDSRFWIPELQAGIPLGWGGMAHLVRLVGETMAADVVLSCRPFGPNEALQAGFVSRVVAHADFDTETDHLLSTIVAKPSLPLRATKDQLKAIRRGTFDSKADATTMLAAVSDAEAGAVFSEYADHLD